MGNHAHDCSAEHQQPDPQKLQDLREILKEFKLTLRGDLEDMRPGELQRVMKSVEGTPEERFLSNIVLRSMKRAFYSEENIGHFALAIANYGHFTSPIRRYPDLLVHRALLAALGEGEEAPTLGEAREVSTYSSAQERESAKIERDADDICAAYLLETELGERGLDTEFQGEVSGVIRAGAFVAFEGELGDVYEGMLPARTLPGGRYELDREEVSLIGSGEGATALRLGDPVRVKVTGIEGERGRVDLELTGGGGKPPRGGKSGRGG